MHFKGGQFPVLLLIVLLLAAGYVFFGRSRDVSPSERTAFLGTWTDAQGSPGNYIRFYQVARSIPGSLPGIEALEGHALFHDQLGLGDVKATWNYESTTPLRLNILFPDRSAVTPVKIVDHNHILIRIVDTEKVEVWTNVDVFEGPDVIRLTRTTEVR